MCDLPLDPPWRGPNRSMKAVVTLTATRRSPGNMTRETFDLGPMLPSLPCGWVWVIDGLVRLLLQPASSSPLTIWDRPNATTPIVVIYHDAQIAAQLIFPVWIPLDPDLEYQKIQVNYQAANVANNPFQLLLTAHKVEVHNGHN